MKPPDNGLLLSFYPNGSSKFQALYNDGKRHGTWRAWQPDGQLIREESFLNGIHDGESRRFYRDGKIQQLLRYQAGQILYQAEFDERGLKILERFDRS